MDMKKLKDFAEKYLKLYISKETVGHQVEEGFAEECQSLGFEMDCGKAFTDAFPNEHPFENVERLNAVINNVVDIPLLGSAIFSKWRQITHWDWCGDLLSDENRAWFIVAFQRLMDLTAEPQKTECVIMLFPEFVTLQAEIEKLHTEMSMLLLERDELKYVECKNIEMKYMLTLGVLEYKAFELHCAMLRLKRKIELVQAKKNRQEKISVSAIDKLLDEEFAEYQEKLNEQINKMNAALERGKGEVLSAEETKELKSLYRTVVKALHPDIHPNVSEAQIKLFHNAVTAYENGDLNALRIIKEMVSEPTLPEPSENGLTILMKEKELLTKTLDLIKEQITEIKNSYTYNLKPIVQSEELTAEKKADLEDTITQLQEIVEAYKTSIKEMLR